MAKKASAGRKGGAGRSASVSGRSASVSGGAGDSSGAGRKASGPRDVGKGKLEVGNARRDVRPATPPMRRTATKRPAGKTSLQLPGEKAVKKTKRTLPVEPARPSPGEQEPVAPQAVDRRRQIVGTDDAGRRGRR